MRLSEKLFRRKDPFWRNTLGNAAALNTSITHAIESSIAISKSIPEVCGLIWTQWQGIRVRKVSHVRREEDRHTKQKRKLSNSVAVWFYSKQKYFLISMNQPKDIHLYQQNFFLLVKTGRNNSLRHQLQVSTFAVSNNYSKKH